VFCRLSARGFAPVDLGKGAPPSIRQAIEWLRQGEASLQHILTSRMAWAARVAKAVFTLVNPSKENRIESNCSPLDITPIGAGSSRTRGRLDMGLIPGRWRRNWIVTHHTNPYHRRRRSKPVVPNWLAITFRMSAILRRLFRQLDKSSGCAASSDGSSAYCRTTRLFFRR